MRVCEVIIVGKVDLSSWWEKIVWDVVGVIWGNGFGEEEEEDDGLVVLVE